jgi:cell division protein FtsQ
MAVVSRPARVRGALAGALAWTDVERLRSFSLARLLPSGAALILGFSLLAGGVLAYVGARETSVFALRSIEISGAPPRVAAHVRSALRPLQGASLLTIGRARIERRLEGLSDVSHVTFDRDFPHTLRVVVTPAHSIAVLRRGPAAWIVSSDGRVVRDAAMSSAPKLPRIWIPRSSSVDVGATVDDADAARAVRAISLARSERFAVRVKTIRSSSSELTFVLASGVEIRFGDDGDLALKVAVAERIVPLLDHETTYLDVSLPTRPIADSNSQLSS